VRKALVRGWMSPQDLFVAPCSTCSVTCGGEIKKNEKTGTALWWGVKGFRTMKSQNWPNYKSKGGVVYNITVH